jgi:hypothetical protein
LTLLLATGCLGYAELQFLPAMPWILAAVIALVGLAFALEGRWWLPVWAANVLGGLISVFAVVWMGRLYLRSEMNLDIGAGDLPWPAALLPHVGPLVMALLVVKLLRPKQLADYWLLQTIGLLEVALACVLTGEPLFGLLLWAYLFSGLWCLSLLQIQADKQTRTPGAVRVPWPLLGLARAGWWALLAAVLGLGLFLVAPRQGNLVWDANLLASTVQQQIPTGQPGLIDMNRTGIVSISEEQAFEVVVTEGTLDGKPKEDLDARQLWRSRVLEVYRLGRWRTKQQTVGLTTRPGPVPNAMGPAPVIPLRIHQNPELPDLGPTQYFITFNIDRTKTTDLVLAEPIILGKGAIHPYQALPADAGKLKQLFYETDGTLNPIPGQRERYTRYVQVTRPPPPGQEGVTEPLRVRDNEVTHLFPPLPEIRRWTRALLERLAAQHEYGLTPAHLLAAPDKPDAPMALLRKENLHAIARALSDYLATSGEFTYSLRLRRYDHSLDPTVDFLLNVREGHCQRYAGALALMLRSQGIPSRVVAGYRGAEHLGGGRYAVRQSQAHDWVEALVPLAAKNGKDCWVTLDPTPATEADLALMAGGAGFWEDMLIDLESFWHAFVVEFDPDKQQAALLSLWQLLSPGERLADLGEWLADTYAGRFWAKPRFWILTTAMGLLGFALARRLRRRRLQAPAARPAVRVPFYVRLLDILERYCALRPAAGQTPREFTNTAGDHLRTCHATAGLADLPARLTDRFYQVRFGQVPLAEQVQAAIHEQLDRLEKAVRTGFGTVAPAH